MSACACDGGQLRPLDEALAELLARSAIVFSSGFSEVG
ncbi:hypothetical protein, partial [Pseudomonas aeruginosa]